MRVSKYRNRSTEFQGMTFDSRRERDRYIFLSAAQRDGRISDLKCQVTFHLLPAQYETVEVQLKTKVKTERRCVERAVDYIADFTYMKDGQLVVEDTKVNKKILPTEYVLKRKMMLYFHGIKVKEVYKPTEAI